MDLEEGSIQLISDIGITLNSFDHTTLMGLVILLLLLIFSGAISGSEIAFFSLTPNDKEALGRSDKTINQTILKLISLPE